MPGEVIVIVTIVMLIPLTAIVTDHMRRMTKHKAEMLKDEIELEKLKQTNFIAETEKMKLELEKMKLDYTADFTTTGKENRITQTVDDQ